MTDKNVLYLQDFTTEGLNLENYIIRGIKYVEKSEDTCVPTSRLTEGGIDEEFAVVEISSGRGCGLHSIVSILVEGPKPDMSEIDN